MRKYRLISKKGEGTFSEVLKAQSLKTGRYVAVKAMKQHFSTVDKVNNLREIQALRRLSPHPNIVSLLEVLYDRPSGRLALVFELMNMNLYDLIRGRDHYLDNSLIRIYLFQTLASVAHMHEKGIFHRDIKPENILVESSYDVWTGLKLADFGSCRGIYSRKPYTEYISTRWYRAPECLLTDGYYGEAMDTWSIGCVFYEISCLVPLFPGETEKDQLRKIHGIVGTPDEETLAYFKRNASRHVDFSFPPTRGRGLTSVIPGHVPVQMVDLLVKMLQYHPRKRITPKEALMHPYFADLRRQKVPTDLKPFYPFDSDGSREVKPKPVPKMREHSAGKGKGTPTKAGTTATSAASESKPNKASSISTTGGSSSGQMSGTGSSSRGTDSKASGKGTTGKTAGKAASKVSGKGSGGKTTSTAGSKAANRATGTGTTAGSSGPSAGVRAGRNGAAAAASTVEEDIPDESKDSLEASRRSDVVQYTAEEAAARPELAGSTSAFAAHARSGPAATVAEHVGSGTGHTGVRGGVGVGRGVSSLRGSGKGAVSGSRRVVKAAQPARDTRPVKYSYGSTVGAVGRTGGAGAAGGGGTSYGHQSQQHHHGAGAATGGGGAGGTSGGGGGAGGGTSTWSTGGRRAGAGAPSGYSYPGPSSGVGRGGAGGGAFRRGVGGGLSGAAVNGAGMRGVGVSGLHVSASGEGGGGAGAAGAGGGRGGYGARHGAGDGLAGRGHRYTGAGAASGAYGTGRTTGGGAGGGGGGLLTGAAGRSAAAAVARRNARAAEAGGGAGGGSRVHRRLGGAGAYGGVSKAYGGASRRR